MRIPTMVTLCSLVGLDCLGEELAGGAYSGDFERAFLPAEWLLSAAR
jgi:hypothetical protein